MLREQLDMTTAATSVSVLKVVVVENDPSIRQLLIDALAKEGGYKVVGQASSGTEMVRTVLDLEPDLVLFDIHLPHQDGMAALREIRKERMVAAVAITTDHDRELVDLAAEEHVLAYLVWPVKAHQLGPALQIAWARFQELQWLMAENVSLRQTLQNRKIIERAKGVLTKRYRWSEGEAFRRIRYASMNRRVPMVDLAHAILSGEEVVL